MSRYETFSPRNQKSAQMTAESLKSFARYNYPLWSEEKVERYVDYRLNQHLSDMEAAEKVYEKQYTL